MNGDGEGGHRCTQAGVEIGHKGAIKAAVGHGRTKRQTMNHIKSTLIMFLNLSFI